MKNNITEDYCSFEVSKLLKEKGFRCYTNRYYKQDGSIVINFEESSGEREYWFDADSFLGNWNDGRLADKDNNFCWGCKEGGKYFQCFSMPTHALAIKWIRENFGLFINTQPIWYNKRSKFAHFYLIYKDPENEVGNHEDRFEEILEGSHQEVRGNYLNDEKYDKLIFEKEFAFITVEEAVESALLYTLKNLI